MVTITQYLKGARQRRRRKKKCPKLKGCPQKKGVCTKINNMHKPKKPNSAKRKTLTVAITWRNRRKKQRKKVIHAMCCIPGQGHNITVNSDLLIRGGRKPDLPGVKYHVFRNKLDFHGKEKIERKRKRSKYGLKSLKRLLEEGNLGEESAKDVTIKVDSSVREWLYLNTLTKFVIKLDELKYKEINKTEDNPEGIIVQKEEEDIEKEK
jgi:small subunit ribosomal protein S12